MKLPLRAWKEAVAAFIASWRHSPPKQKRRASRSMQLESLEGRRLMTTLLWDPSGQIAAHGGLTAYGGGAGTWDTTSTNKAWWNGSTDVAWDNTSGDTADFGGSATPGTVTVAAGTSAGEIDFTTSGYLLAPGSSGTLAVTGTGVINISSGLRETISTPLDGSNGLTLSNAGTLVLTGANTFTGGTTISEGTLELGYGSSMGSVGGNIADGSALVFDNPSNQTYSGALSGSGTLTMSGSATETLTGTNSLTGAMTISAGTLELGYGSSIGSITDNSALVFDNASDVTDSGVISGYGSLTMSGSATLTLSGSNTYDGGTTINSGTVALGSSTALGNGGSPGYGGVTINGGTLDLAGNDPTIGALAGSGGYVTNSGSSATFNVEGNNSNSTFAGVIESGIALDKTGSGTLILTGTNTDTGATTIGAGTLELGNGSIVGSLAGNITDNSVLAFDNPSAQTYSGVISGSGSLTKSGSGTLTLSGSNSYDGSGGTTITAGTLQVDNSTALGSTANALWMSGGTLDLNAFTETVNAFYGVSMVTNNASGGATLIVGSANGDSYNSGTIENGTSSGGTVTLEQTGTGELQLGGTDTSSGVVEAYGGTLQMISSTALGSNANLDISSGATFDLHGYGEVFNSFSGSSGSVMTNSASSTTATLIMGANNGYGGFYGTFENGTGSGGGVVNFEKDGTGSFTLGGTDSSTGSLEAYGGTFSLATSTSTSTTIWVMAGTLQVAYASALTSTPELYIYGGTLDLNGYSETLNDLYGSSGTIITNNSSTASTLTVDSGTFGGTMENGSGTVALVKNTSSTLTLSGANTYTGGTTINAGYVDLGGSSALYDGGEVTINGGTLDIEGYDPTIGELAGSGGYITNSGSSAALTVNSSASSAFNGTIENGSGSGHVLNLVKQGTGTQTLNGSNTDSGGTTIEGGTLQLGSSTALGSGGVVLDNTGSGATVDLNGQSVSNALSSTGAYGGTITTSSAASLSGAISIGSSGLTVNEAGALTLGGAITGTGSLTKTGSGTLTLSGASTYSGATTVTSGTLKAGAVDTFSDNSDFTVNSTLDLGGYSQSIGSLSGSGTVTDSASSTMSILTVGADGNNTEFDGLLENGDGGLGLTVIGGQLILTESNSYDGGTILDGGGLQLGKDAADNDGSIAGNITDDGALTFDYYSSETYSGIITGSGSLTDSGPGTLTLSGPSAYSGATTVDASATLKAGATNALSANSDYIIDGTLDLYDTDQTIGSLSGTGAVTNSGSTASVLTVGADGNYTEFDGLIENGSGGLGLTVIGGQLTLGGDNTYTGGTILDGGGLQLGNGTSGFDGSLAGNITDDGSLTFDYYADETFSGVITGTGSVTDSGPGTATLSSESAYFGTTTVDANATLKAGVANAFSPDSDYTVNSEGTLNLGGHSQTLGSLAGSGMVTDSASGTIALTTQADGNSTLFSGTIQNGSGTVELFVAGAGSLALTGSQTYTVGTTIDAGGTLQLGDGATANGSVDCSITDDGTLVFANPDSQNFSEAISGSGSLVVSGPGALTLSGSSSYTGTTTVDADVALTAGATDALSDASNFTVLGTLDLAGYGQTIGTLAGNGTVESSSGSAVLTTTTSVDNPTEFDGVLENEGGTLGLTVAGAGTLTLTGVNTYSGATAIDTGATLLAAASDTFSDNSGYTVSGTLQLGGLNEAVPSIAGSGTVENGAAGTISYLTVGDDGSSDTFAGTIEDGSGVLGVIKTGSNTLTLSGTATYSGGTTGSIADAPSGLVSKDVSSGGTFDLEGQNWTFSSLSGDDTVTVTNSDSGTTAILTILNSSADTFSGTIQDDGTGKVELVFAGSATFTLDGTSTYSGPTTIDAGATLAAGVADAFSANSDLTINAGGTLDLANFDEEIGSLSGSGTVTNSVSGTSILTVGADNSSKTFSGTIENGDSGAGLVALTVSGTGIATLTGTSTYTGGTTINSSATLQLGDGTANNGVVAGGIVDYGTLVFANATAQTYAGAISETGAVTVNGLDTITLSGSSTYSGMTTITAGTLQAGADDTLSANSEYVVNDTLDLNGYNEAISSLSGTGEVTNNSSAATPSVLTVSGDSAGTEFDGILQDGTDEGGGTLGLTVYGTGNRLKLGGYSAYSGTTTIDTGTTLQATQADSFSPESSFAVNGTLDLNGNNQQIAALTGSGTVGNSATGTAAFLAVGDNGSADTFSGTIEDGGGVLGLVKVGTNTLTLSGTSSYTGGTTTDAGSVTGPASPPGGVSGDRDLAGSNLTLASLTGSGTITNSDSGVTVVLTIVNSSADTFGGEIEGNIELVVAGSATLTLTGANSYTGGTNIDGGTLQIGDDEGGTNASVTDNITDNGTLIFDNPEPQLYSGAITGLGGVTLESPVTVTMTAASSYYGSTIVDSSATLAVNGANLLSENSDYTINSATTLDLAGYSQTIGSLAGSGTVESSTSAATLTTQADGNSTEFTGTLEDGSGGLALSVASDGFLMLAGTSSYDGATTVESGAMIQAGASGALSDNSDFTIDSTGALDLNGFNATVGSLAGAGTVTNSAPGTASFLTEGYDGNSETFSGTITDGAGVLGLIKDGANTLTLSGTLSYSGGTTNPDSISGALPTEPQNEDVTSSLDLDGHNMTVLSLTGDGTVYNSVAGSTAVLTILNASADTFGGTIEDGSGVVGLVLDGSSTLTLSGESTYSGATTVTSGTLKAGAINTFSDNSDFTVNSTLDLGGYSQSIGSLAGSGTVTDSASGTDVILTTDGDGNSSEFSGTLANGSGTLGLTVTGSGGLTLTGSDSYSGTTTIDGGTLQLGDGQSANGALTMSNVLDNGSLVFANVSDETYSGVISGSGTVTVEGAAVTAVLALSGASTYAGATTVTSGTLQADGNNVLSPNSTYEVDSTLDLDGSDQTIGSLSGSGIVTNSVADTTAILTAGGDNTSTTFSGIIQNGSTGGVVALTKTGDGVLTLEGANTYTGSTIIDGGTIELSSNGHQILNAPPSGYANGIVPADLSNAYNWTGITNNTDAFSGISAMQSGGIDGDNHALSETLLGASKTVSGVTFDFGPSEASDVVVADGQTVDLPQAEFSAIDILATSVGTNTGTQTFTVTYSDGTTATFNQSMHLWTSSSTYSGESVALTMSYLNTSSGGTASGTDYYVYEYSFAVDPTKTVVSLTLPDNANIMLLAATGIAPTGEATSLTATPTSTSDIELTWTAPSGTVSGYYVYRGQTSGGESTTALNSTELAAGATSYVDTTAVPGNMYYYTVVAMDDGTADSPSNEASVATPTAGSTTEVDLTSAFNFTGIVSDSSTFSSTGGLDGEGHALSATVLANNPNWNGIPFIYGAAGGENVVQATGQTITLPTGQFSQLEILATAVSADQDSQIFTVNYADGTSQTFTQTVSGWTDSGTAAVSGHEDVYGGTNGSTVNIWGYTFDVNPAETVASITLPDNANVFVLGMTLHTVNILPTGSNVQIADGALLELNGTDQQIGSLSGARGSYVDLGGATLTVGGSGNTAFAGTIYGTGGFVYSGGSTLTLSGANSYSGTTTVSAGTLQAGSAGAFSSNSDYVVTSTLDLNSYSPTIGSLAGSGTVTDSAASTTSVLTVGDGISTAFSGVIQNGSGTVGLDVVVGSSTFTLSGANTYTGPTQINTGTLQVNTNVIPSAVTIGPSGTLDGNGGTGQVTNLGGTYSAEFYQVTIVASSLQRGDAASPNSGSDALVSGGNGKVLALSAAGAAFLALTGSATSSSTYALNSVNFTYNSDLVVVDASGVSHNIGPALVFNDGGGEDADAGYGSYTGIQQDYFPLTDALNSTAPIANQDFYQDGVGGVLTKDAAAGLLANDTDQTSGTSLSIYSHTNPANGTLSLSSDGSFTYTPNTGFYGTDSFTYIASDGTNQSAPTTVTIQVLLPQIGLLDDANNDGSINSADEPIKDTGTGAIVLVSNDSGYSNADANHLAQLNITALDSLFESLPSSLSGWTLDLDVVNGSGGAAKIWSSIDKTTELDTGGQISWSLSDIGSIPSSLFLELTTVGAFAVDLALYAPSATSPAATSQVEVTSTAGRLIASQILGNVPVKQPDGTLNPLPSGQTAFVPLDNEDFNYYQPLSPLPSLEDDYKQPAGAIQDDQFLMPIVVQGNPGIGGTYTITIPNNIEVFANPDRTGLIGPNVSVITSGTYYVEGVADGTGTLQLYWRAGDTSDFRLESQLAITVFEFGGTQNVPNYSNYVYSVSGLNPAAGSWGVDNDPTDHLTGSNNSSAAVKWGVGGGTGYVSYKINPYYKWNYIVNVVAININNTTQSTPAFSITGATTQQFHNGSAILRDGITNVTSVGLLSAPNPQQAFTMRASVEMKGAGKNHTWGVDQMQIGFIQLLNNLSATADYISFFPIKTATLKSTLNNSHAQYDTPKQSPNGFVWTSVQDQNGKRTFIQDSQGGTDDITWSDTPQISIPVSTPQAQYPAKGPVELLSASISYNFTDYIAARVNDDHSDADSNGTFTVIAQAPQTIADKYTWSWRASGEFNGSLVYSATGQTPSVQGPPAGSTWEPIQSGKRFTPTHLPQDNFAFENAKWE
jgi:fibronectin-binding autotransporter adhesin